MCDTRVSCKSTSLRFSLEIICFQRWETGCSDALHCRGFRLSMGGLEGTANSVCSLSPCQEPAASRWKCTFSQWPNSSAEDPVTSQSCSHHTLFFSLCGPRAGGSQLTAHSSTAWPWGWPQPPPAPDQPAGMGSSHPGPRVELLAISEPCNVLKPSGPRDKAPLSSFSFFPEKAFLHNVHF